ncbi:hypothetical protein EB001_19530 [bacterium]|jgi:hypothetical protein|nr:hypothetical protein [bacterium]
MDTKNLTCETGIEVIATRSDLEAGGDNGVLVTISTDMSGMDVNELITVKLKLKEDGTLSVLVVENTTGQPLGIRKEKSRSEYPKYVKMLAEGHRERGDWHTANYLLETLK